MTLILIDIVRLKVLFRHDSPGTAGTAFAVLFFQKFVGFYQVYEWCFIFVENFD